MAKKYYELYQDVMKLKPKTLQYYRTVSKMFGITIDKNVLMKVREFRKEERYKQGRTLSQAYNEYAQGVKYENEVIQRAYDIWSGAYFDKVTNRYVDNYLSALELNGISDDIIDFLRNNPHIVKMGALPPITDFYVPSKGKGKKYHLNIEQSDELEETLRDFLNETWDADL